MLALFHNSLRILMRDVYSDRLKIEQCERGLQDKFDAIVSQVQKLRQTSRKASRAASGRFSANLQHFPFSVLRPRLGALCSFFGASFFPGSRSS